MPNQEQPVLRDYCPEDFEQVKAIHDRMGLDYEMPALNSPLFVVRKVLAIGDRVLGIGVLRVELEAYLWLEPSLLAQEKLAAIELLQGAGLAEATTKGYENVVAWIPEEVEVKFEKRLKQLGWSRDRDGWRSWSRSTKQC